MHEDIKDPLSDMIRLLNEKKDTALIRKWGVWLLKRDPERGLKVHFHSPVEPVSCILIGSYDEAPHPQRFRQAAGKTGRGP